MSDPAAALGPLAALVLGLASSGHCLGMCGPVALALGATTGAGRWRRRWLLLAMGLGRIGTYAVIGAAGAGAVGTLGRLLAPHLARSLLALAASLVLAALALRLLGLGGGWQRLERAGLGLWRRVAPLTRSLLPVNSAAQALAVGALWGLLPCGLVYGAALWAAGAGDPLRAAGYMLCFGAGTLPAVLGSAALASWLTARRQWRLAAGGLLLAVAVASAWVAVRSLGPSHAGHGPHAGAHRSASSPAPSS